MAAGAPPLQDPSSALRVTVGREHFRHGEIALTVHGSGEVEVVQLRSGSERHWRGRLAPERLTELAAEVAELDVAGLRPRGGDRDPDDDPIHLALRSGPRGHDHVRRRQLERVLRRRLRRGPEDLLADDQGQARPRRRRHQGRRQLRQDRRDLALQPALGLEVRPARAPHGLGRPRLAPAPGGGVRRQGSAPHGEPAPRQGRRQPAELARRHPGGHARPRAEPPGACSTSTRT